MSYQELNVALVEAFGDLERLCNDIYSEQHGVTCYIKDMENSYGGSSRVRGWALDLEKLRDVRAKRNKLTHNEVSFSSPYAEQGDIDFIIDFHRRIMDGQDPIALYNKSAGHAEPARGFRPENSSAPFVYNRRRRLAAQPVGCGVYMALAAAAVAAVLLLI